MFNKQEFKNFRNDVEVALREVAEKYNVDIRAGKINYTEIDFNMKLEVKAREVNGVSYEQAEFNEYCVMFGFKESDYNKEFTYGNKKYNLIGFKPRSRKYPVLVKKEDGKTYKMTTEIVKQLIAS